MTWQSSVRGLAVLLALTLGGGLAIKADETDKRLFQLQYKIAQGGDPNAQYYLGEMYEQGLGTEVNLEEAFKWYSKAAEQGHPYAKRKLAMRKEIEAEHEREHRVAEALRAAPAATQGKPATPPPAAPAARPAPKAPVKVAEQPARPSPEEAARLEEERNKAAAERAKKREAIRRMLLEMKQQWQGEAFE